jgi:1-acyl-sn-glycerol-3-phosphate acyltransferase
VATTTCDHAAVPFLYRLAGWLMLVFAGWRKRWIGLEHVPPGGFVLAANHLSNIDPFILGLPLFPRRRVRYMAKAELFNRWLGPVMRHVGTFPVRRGEVDTDALRTALVLLSDNEIVGMFPEGTRAKKGMRKRFTPMPHAGTARIALTAGVPLVPAGIAGTDRLLGLGRFRVAFGPPVELGDLSQLPKRQAAEVATERLMAAIRSLVAEAERA